MTFTTEEIDMGIRKAEYSIRKSWSRRDLPRNRRWIRLCISVIRDWEAIERKTYTN